MLQMSQRKRSKVRSFIKNIEIGYKWMKPNYERYNNFIRMVDVSTISPDEKQFNLSQNRPNLEFNEHSRLISQLSGEFSKHQVGIAVNKKDSSKETESDVELIKFFEGHLRYQFHEMKVNGVEYDVFTQILKGGYSGGKAFADYREGGGFEQDIFVETLYDPTLMGFDPFARKVDKSDGMFIYEGIPYDKNVAEKEFNIKIEKVNASYSVDGYKWAFKQGTQEVVLVIDYYYKKFKYEDFVLLSNYDEIREQDYDEYVRLHRLESVEQPPVIIAGPIKKKRTTIWRAKIVGDYLIEDEPTSLKKFPIVFCDGNSSLIKDRSNTNIEFHTKPLVYDAVGAQRLKNFAGQSLAFSLMKTIQSNFMASNESMMGQNLQPWKNPQVGSLLLYNEFSQTNPEVRLSPPIPIQPQPIPPEIMQAFQEADRTMTNIMGGMDLSQADLTQQQMSGKAIQQLQTLGNAAAMPFVNNMIRWCQSIAENIMELIVMYYTMPRSVPVMDGRGHKSYVKINQQGGLMIKDINIKDFDIKIEAGASFQVQQERTKQEIVALANAIPEFGRFIAEVGIPILLDNLAGIRGIEELKRLFDEWSVEQKEMQAQMAQMPNPDLMKVELADKKLMMESQLAEQKMIIEDREAKIKALTDIGKLKIDKEKNQIEAIKVGADILESRERRLMDIDRQANDMENREFDNILSIIGAYQENLKRNYEEMERNFKEAIGRYEKSADRQMVESV